MELASRAERAENGSDVSHLPGRPPRCGSLRERSYGGIAVNNDIKGRGKGVRQIKPSDRKATCLLAEGKQITPTRHEFKTCDGCQRNIRSIAARRFEKSGAETYLSKKTYLESVSINWINNDAD